MAWMEIQDGSSENELKKRILSSDVCISDLDGTDADPARIVASNMWKPSLSLRPQYWGWLASVVQGIAREGEASHSRLWLEYTGRFLSKPSELNEVANYFDDLVVLESLFPGVEDFYGSLNGTKKVYVTRNILPVAKAYMDTLGFSGVFAQTFDKEHFMANFIDGFGFKKLLIKGDSLEDEAMIGPLEYHKQKGKIDDYLFINMCSSSGKTSDKATVNIGNRSYESLVQLLD